MEKSWILLVAFVLLISGCIASDGGQNTETGDFPLPPLNLYGDLAGTDPNSDVARNVVFVRPGDEFTIDIRALNLGNEDLQETISMNADEYVEFLDNNRFEATIKPNDKETILKSVRLRINSKGYHRIQIEALPTQGSRNITNYMLGSFHACVVDNLDEAPTVCSDFDPGYIDYMLNNKELFAELFLVD